MSILDKRTFIGWCISNIDDRPAIRDIKKLMDRAETLRKRTQELHDEVVDIEQKSQDRLARTTVLMEKARKLLKARELHEEAGKRVINIKQHKK